MNNPPYRTWLCLAVACCCALSLFGQDRMRDMPRRGGRDTHGHGSTLVSDTLRKDTIRRTEYWTITERTGEQRPAKPDTLITDYFNRTNVEGQSVAMAYLGNLGLPGESRIFFERPDRSQFMFTDPYAHYTRSPERYPFLNTTEPFSTVAYQRAGGNETREERFQALISSNFGKKLNVGVEADYLYARGFYKSQSAKHFDWVAFANYRSDRHIVHAFFNPYDYNNAENGGIGDDNDIVHPEYKDNRGISSRDIMTRLSSTTNTTWNAFKGRQAYLNYRFNLGYREGEENEEDTTSLAAEAEALAKPLLAPDTTAIAAAALPDTTATAQPDSINPPRKKGNRLPPPPTAAAADTVEGRFIPVGSIIYTFNYKTTKKRFYTENPTAMAAFYANRPDAFPDLTPGLVADSTNYQTINNTVALSMREGFSSWAKFDLTAYLSHEMRTFNVMTGDTLTPLAREKQNSTYVGGEITKSTGKILRYHGQGSFGLLGYNLGDFNLSGAVETRIPLWGDTAAVEVNAFIKNLAPTYYENHYRSRYFWWDNDFNKVRKVRLGGKITIPHTQTILSAGVENITNYIYFDSIGSPQQYTSNIQVVSARIDQSLAWRALHWDNQVVWQKSSEPTILPLPDLAAYSSLYVQFKVAKVLTMQIGVNAHYWTKYYAPSYEPATQQFKNQDQIEVGNYPLVSAFVNCHLKQTRFFVEYYNAGMKFIKPTEYFSLPHYPVDPTVIKLGVAIDFVK